PCDRRIFATVSGKWKWYVCRQIQGYHDSAVCETWRENHNGFPCDRPFSVTSSCRWQLSVCSDIYGYRDSAVCVTWREDHNGYLLKMPYMVTILWCHCLIP